MSSDRLKKIGFKPKHNVQKAIIDLKSMFNANLLKNDKKFYSVNWLKEKLERTKLIKFPNEFKTYCICFEI